MKYLKLYEKFKLLLEADDKSQKHLVLIQDRKKDKNILIIPGTGEGDAGFYSDYNILAKKLSADYNVYSCNWPANFDVEQFAKECVEDIEKIGGKWIVGGYSFGYRMAYKIAKVLESKNSEFFLNKVFGIDGFVFSSKDEEFESLKKNNPPRVAVAYSKQAIEKSRKNQDIVRDKDFFIFRSEESLKKFLNEKKCQTYLGEDEYTPMDLSTISADWIIENKFPKGEDWKIRYNPPADDYKNSEGKYFKEEDIRMLKSFMDRTAGKSNDSFSGPLKSELLVIFTSKGVVNDISKRVSNKIQFKKVTDTSIGHDNICTEGASEVSGFINSFIA
jgi:hypothetical protein